VPHWSAARAPRRRRSPRSVFPGSSL